MNDFLDREEPTEPGFGLIVERLGHGVACRVDHPIGELVWVLPRPRAEELVARIHELLGLADATALRAALREALEMIWKKHIDLARYEALSTLAKEPT